MPSCQKITGGLTIERKFQNDGILEKLVIFANFLTRKIGTIWQV